jgi:hypothetical protein
MDASHGLWIFLVKIDIYSCSGYMTLIFLMIIEAGVAGMQMVCSYLMKNLTIWESKIFHLVKYAAKPSYGET